jgi:hypothetical protein
MVAVRHGSQGTRRGKGIPPVFLRCDDALFGAPLNWSPHKMALESVCCGHDVLRFPRRMWLFERKLLWIRKKVPATAMFLHPVRPIDPVISLTKLPHHAFAI